MARSRDPGAFAKLAALCTADPANAATKQTALRRIAAVLAANGGTVAQITVGDCLHLVQPWPPNGATPACTSTSCCKP
jgi:hypothetical protein